MYHLYILRCKDRTLYCGITKNLEKREQAHNLGRGSKYVRSRGGGRIVYSEKLRTLGQALSREAEIKNLTRKEKLNLVKNGRSI